MTNYQDYYLNMTQIELRLPRELDNVIWSYLDRTSRGLWRVADPIIARSFKQPKKKEHGLPSSASDTKDAHTDITMQAIYDDHVAAFRHFWDNFIEWGINCDQEIRFYHIAQRAAIEGGSIRIFNALITMSNCVRLTDEEIIWKAVGHGRMNILQQFNEENIFNALNPYTFNVRFGLARQFIKEKKMRHPVYQMASRHQIRNCEFIWTFIHYFGPYQQIVNVCAAYAVDDYQQLLTQHPKYCNQDLVLYIVHYGNRANALKWLQIHKPELFKNPTLIKNLKCGTTWTRVADRGCVAIMQWMNENGYFSPSNVTDMVKIHTLLFYIEKNEYLAAGKWLNKQLIGLKGMDAIKEKLINIIDVC